MRFGPKAKPIKIRIMSGGEEHSSLDTLKLNFCLKDIEPLLDGRLSRWLAQQNENQLSTLVDSFKGSGLSCENTLLNFLSVFFSEDYHRKSFSTLQDLAKFWVSDNRYIRNLVYLLSFEKLDSSIALRILKSLSKTDNFGVLLQGIITLNNERSYFLLGLFYIDNGDKVRGVDYIKKAADKGFQDAKYYMASKRSLFDNNQNTVASDTKVDEEKVASFRVGAATNSSTFTNSEKRDCSHNTNQTFYNSNHESVNHCKPVNKVHASTVRKDCPSSKKTDEESCLSIESDSAFIKQVALLKNNTSVDRFAGIRRDKIREWYSENRLHLFSGDDVNTNGFFNSKEKYMIEFICHSFKIVKKTPDYIGFVVNQYNKQNRISDADFLFVPRTLVLVIFLAMNGQPERGLKLLDYLVDYSIVARNFYFNRYSSSWSYSKYLKYIREIVESLLK